MLGLGRRIIGVALLAIAAMSVAAPALAGGGKYQDHCITPTGLDLNERWGVSERVVTPFCSEVRVGEKWRPLGPAWFTAETHDIIPPGYQPLGSTPIEDFNAKIQSLRYVLDPGTKKERTFTFGPEVVLTQAPAEPVSAFAPLFHPLPPGSHTVQVYVTLSADHWDGFDTNPFENLVPAGETLWAVMSFEVVTPDKAK